MSLDSDVLVVGAGPTGLTLALQASRMGAKVRVVERRSTPRVWAPALAIHPRTLETLRSLGVADELLARGLAHVDLDIHVDETVVSGSLGRLNLPETEFPFVFFAPQPEVEAVLVSALAAVGVEVEWGSDFQGCEPAEEGMACRLKRDGEVRTVTTGYLVGCDGSDSTVRRDAGIRFRGRSYRETISIADASADLQPDTAHAFLRGRGILFFFPLPSGRWRIIGPGVVNETAVEVKALVERHTGGLVGIDDVDWVRVVRPQHRLASAYRMGRVFLAGDAAHVHSPAGAQGMNTGIQDAANLGWKLAFAARGAPDDLLDTYEAERRPVAKHVVRLTGLAFGIEVSEFAPMAWGRRWAAKPIASLLAPH
ncbi:MAG: FAD-dependent monooxygenase, partial [Acidimicrobiia bacterium]